MKSNISKGRNFLLLAAIIFSLQLVNAESYLVSKELVRSHTTQSLKAIWKENKIPKFIMPVNYGVDIYEIIYRVPWIDSTWRTASGIVYVPKNVKKPVPTMMYGHGTQIHKFREISDKDAQQGICLGFATDGYLALYPDYYGIGKGEGRHLYQHAWTQGMAFIYMLYAVEELRAELGLETSGQLFLTGYSQGGHASLSAHKYLEKLNDPRFKVTASSPMSGAYDMTGEQAKYMFEVYPRPFYLPYLLISYQKAYEILDVEDIYTIFRAPFDTLLPIYFEENRSKDLYELDQLMPKVPIEVLKDEFVEDYLNDDHHEFKCRLEENNLVHWKPEAPVMLCYCKGDREVNYKNAEVAYQGMKAHGAKKVKLNNLSDQLDHNTCAAFAVLATKYYFNRYVKKGDNPKMKDLPRFKKFLAGFVKRKTEKEYARDGQDNSFY